MDTNFKSIIEEAKSILILLPKASNLDQVAAGLSLYLSLKAGKDVSISCPTPMTVEFNRLVGINKITSELENKNLVIRFVEYQAEGIERVSYDIEDGEFKLTVIPKLGLPAPKRDQVHLSFSGVSADTVVLIGGVREDEFPALFKKDRTAYKLVHIGTRVAEIKGVLSFAKQSSSLSELTYDLIKESGLPIDQDIATNLLAGIESGSHNFRGYGVSANTFLAFAELLNMGGIRFVRGGKDEKIPEVLPQPQPGVRAPDDWLEPPKIYKGTTIT